MHTSIWPRIGTDVPQSNHIFCLQPCGKAQESRSFNPADGKQQRPQACRRNRRKRVNAHLVVWKEEAERRQWAA